MLFKGSLTVIVVMPMQISPYCSEAFRYPDNLNRLVSPLVRAPYSWSVGHEFESPAGDRTLCANWTWKANGVRSSTRLRKKTRGDIKRRVFVRTRQCCPVCTSLNLLFSQRTLSGCSKYWVFHMKLGCLANCIHNFQLLKCIKNVNLILFAGHQIKFIAELSGRIEQGQRYLSYVHIPIHW